MLQNTAGVVHTHAHMIAYVQQEVGGLGRPWCQWWFSGLGAWSGWVGHHGSVNQDPSWVEAESLTCWLTWELLGPVLEQSHFVKTKMQRKFSYGKTPIREYKS